jgi:hypothetical protein
MLERAMTDDYAATAGVQNDNVPAPSSAGNSVGRRAKRNLVDDLSIIFEDAPSSGRRSSGGRAKRNPVGDLYIVEEINIVKRAKQEIKLEREKRKMLEAQNEAKRIQLLEENNSEHRLLLKELIDKLKDKEHEDNVEEHCRKPLVKTAAKSKTAVDCLRVVKTSSDNNGHSYFNELVNERQVAFQRQLLSAEVIQRFVLVIAIANIAKERRIDTILSNRHLEKFHTFLEIQVSTLSNNTSKPPLDRNSNRRHSPVESCLGTVAWMVDIAPK